MSESQFIYGFHAVKSKIKQSIQSIIKVYIDQNRNDHRLREVLELLRESGRDIKINKVDSEKLSYLAGGENVHQGIVVEILASGINTSYKNFDEFLDENESKESCLILMLDGIQDPHNLGACLRVADVFGVDAVVAPKDRAVGLSSTVAKVASGAVENIPYFTVTNLARTIEDLKNDFGFWVVGTAMEDAKFLAEVNLKQHKKLVLIMGAEGAGIRRLTRESCDELVKIPMFGQVESLNVSVATGICLYEIKR